MQRAVLDNYMITSATAGLQPSPGTDLYPPGQLYANPQVGECPQHRIVVNGCVGVHDSTLSENSTHADHRHGHYRDTAAHFGIVTDKGPRMNDRRQRQPGGLDQLAPSFAQRIVANRSNRRTAGAGVSGKIIRFSDQRYAIQLAQGRPSIIQKTNGLPLA
ncbi:hypothetical protein FB481_1143 [Pseudomonas sp. AG1028]|nr:hypothetical protein FB481_1143 [Pseudomonas sp. AG1028]